MQIYPDENTQFDSPVGFEIDNIYVSLSAVVQILNSVNGVTDIEKRKLFSKWEDIHIWFKYMNQEYVVIEPFGDSSRYWIGVKNISESTDLNVSPIVKAFNDYEPPFLRSLIGDILSFKFFKQREG